MHCKYVNAHFCHDCCIFFVRSQCRLQGMAALHWTCRVSMSIVSRQTCSQQQVRRWSRHDTAMPVPECAACPRATHLKCCIHFQRAHGVAQQVCRLTWRTEPSARNCWTKTCPHAHQQPANQCLSPESTCSPQSTGPHCRLSPCCGRHASHRIWETFSNSNSGKIRPALYTSNLGAEAHPLQLRLRLVHTPSCQELVMTSSQQPAGQAQQQASARHCEE
jgi:hypothetical protein